MSQIGTTIEQSKRLINAGVKQDTADMMWILNRLVFSAKGTTHEWQLNTIQLTACETEPAWSLSALWDLLSESNITLEYATYMSSDALIESLVTAIERFAKRGRI